MSIEVTNATPGGVAIRTPLRTFRILLSRDGGDPLYLLVKGSFIEHTVNRIQVVAVENDQEDEVACIYLNTANYWVDEDFFVGERRGIGVLEEACA